MSERCATNPQSSGTEHRRCTCHYQPNVDIYEQPDELVILADLPGASPDSIEIDYEENELSLKARVDSRQEAGTRFLVREYGVGDYHRRFRIGEAVDTERIAASYTDGVLTVRLPKVQAAKPRRVAVHSDDGR